MSSNRKQKNLSQKDERRNQVNATQEMTRTFIVASRYCAELLQLANPRADEL